MNTFYNFRLLNCILQCKQYHMQNKKNRNKIHEGIFEVEGVFAENVKKKYSFYQFSKMELY